MCQFSQANRLNTLFCVTTFSEFGIHGYIPAFFWFVLSSLPLLLPLLSDNTCKCQKPSVLHSKPCIYAVLPPSKTVRFRNVIRYEKPSFLPPSKTFRFNFLHVSFCIFSKTFVAVPVYAVFSSFQPFLGLSVTMAVVYTFCISMCLETAKNGLLVRPVFSLCEGNKKTGCICPFHLLLCCLLQKKTS